MMAAIKKSYIVDYLPEEIFRIIQTFLSLDDYHYFLNCAKVLGDLKRKTIYFPLNQKSTKLYCQDTSFQKLLLSKVENGWNQIGITPRVLKPKIPLDLPLHKIYFSFDEFPFECWNNYKSIKCNSSRSPMKGLPLLRNVEELELLNDSRASIDLTPLSHLSLLSLSNVTGSDLTPLKDIPDLTLDSFPDVTNFSMFSNQKNLVIRQCLGLTDVTSFRTIRKVILSECLSVTDVCSLNGVYDLSLISCHGIKDISGLGNHHRLLLNRVSRFVNDYSCLLHIAHVSLISCNIKDLSVLQYAKSVYLSMCFYISDVSALRHVKRVEIYAVQVMSGLHELSEVPDLSLYILGQQQQLSSDYISHFKNKRLTLSADRLEITSLSLFSHSIEQLILAGSNNIGRVNPIGSLMDQGEGSLLRHLHALRLDSISLRSLKGLGDIPTVKLSHCRQLRDLRGLGRNRFVKVTHCSELEDVSTLATVPIVTIKHCRRLTKQSYEPLKNVPRLKVE